jgi:hypothetical protein
VGVSGFDRVAVHERSCEAVKAEAEHVVPARTECLKTRVRLHHFRSADDHGLSRSMHQHTPLSTSSFPGFIPASRRVTVRKKPPYPSRHDTTRPTHPAGTFAQALTALRAQNVDGAKAGRERASLEDAVSMLRCRRTVLVRCRRGDEKRVGMERSCGSLWWLS